jgi:hypothetical protein
METKRKALRISGAIQVLLAIGHVGFPWLFSWSTALASLDKSNRALVALHDHRSPALHSRWQWLHPRSISAFRSGGTHEAERRNAERGVRWESAMHGARHA